MGSDGCFGDKGTARGLGVEGDGGGRATAEERWCGLGSALEMLTLSWLPAVRAVLSGYQPPAPTISRFPTSSALQLLFTLLNFEHTSLGIGDTCGGAVARTMQNSAGGGHVTGWDEKLQKAERKCQVRSRFHPLAEAAGREREPQPWEWGQRGRRCLQTHRSGDRVSPGTPEHPIWDTQQSRCGRWEVAGGTGGGSGGCRAQGPVPDPSSSCRAAILRRGCGTGRILMRGTAPSAPKSSPAIAARSTPGSRPQPGGAGPAGCRGCVCSCQTAPSSLATSGEQEQRIKEPAAQGQGQNKSA